MRRRDFIAFLSSGVATLPVATYAQQSKSPIIGFLRSTPAAPFAHLVTAFRAGLRESGFVEGRNVTLEQRWADNHPERLPALASDLVRSGVSVIVGNGIAVEAARSITREIPIVFVVADDPVASGFVTSLSRPGGNLTGVTFFGAGQLSGKRIELLHELIPSGQTVAILFDPNYRGSDEDLTEAQAAGRMLGLRIVAVSANGEKEFSSAFERIVAERASAVLVSGGPVFTSQRKLLVTLAARHRMTAIYDQRDFVADGGLVSYAASFTGAYRQAGVYAALILKGAKPSELPVQQPTTFELAINLKAAKELGLAIPPSLLARADEVIE